MGNTQRLTPQHRAFITAYATQSSPTYGNARQSYKKANPHVTIASATVGGSKLLNRPQIKSEVDRVLAEQGFDLSARMAAVVRVATGKQTRTTVQRSLRTDKETGKSEMVATGETVSAPTFGDQLQAVHILSKLTGDYERPKIAGDIARQEYKELTRRIMREAKADTITSTAEVIEDPPEDNPDTILTEILARARESVAE